MKEFNKLMVEDMIKLRYGKLVYSPTHTAYASYSSLGKIFGASRMKIRELILELFEYERRK